MRQACFDYLSLGGIYSSGPVSLLSGLNPRPSVLVTHFFMVALYGVGRTLFSPRPTLRGLWTGALLLLGAARIILPIIAAEGPVAVFAPWLLRRRPPVVPGPGAASASGAAHVEDAEDRAGGAR
jgi:squalene monooxygenase